MCFPYVQPNASSQQNTVPSSRVLTPYLNEIRLIYTSDTDSSKKKIQKVVERILMEGRDLDPAMTVQRYGSWWDAHVIRVCVSVFTFPLHCLPIGYGLNVCVPRIHRWNLIPQCNHIWRWGLWEIIRSGVVGSTWRMEEKGNAKCKKLEASLKSTVPITSCINLLASPQWFVFHRCLVNMGILSWQECNAACTVIDTSYIIFWWELWETKY